MHKILFTLFFIFLIPGHLLADEQEARAIAFVKSLAQEAIEEAKMRDAIEARNEVLAGEDEKSHPDKSFKDIFNHYFDGNYIGRFILGKYWRRATPEQRQEYLALFNCLVITAYEQRFADYKGERLIITGAHHSGKFDVIVSSLMTQPDTENVRINWRVREKNNYLKIIDVVVEDISLSLTQRSEYAAILQKNAQDIDALLAKMREKICECHCEHLFEQKL